MDFRSAKAADSTLAAFIREMPKVELHVHLQGSTQPETLLKLAKSNGVSLPGTTIEAIRDWYTFRDFDHFIEIYGMVTRCLCSGDDVETVTRDFLAGQAAQNIVYSEVTYTPTPRFPFSEQLQGINRAREWGEKTLGVTCGVVIDIPRHIAPDEGLTIADWAISGFGNGVVAFGLGGPEAGNPPEKFADAFARVRAAGMPCVPHAGEHVGPESVWSALRVCEAVRIGHGVRSVEDPALVSYLRDQQIPLEVCPTSNVILKAYPTLADHPIQQLIEAGVIVTVNSDDPPMFNTTLTNEFEVCAETFGWDADTIERLTLNAVHSSLLPPHEKTALAQRFETEFQQLRTEYHL